MKSMKTRGLSDIVTTVLIILLVVAAVVVIWNFVRPTIDQAGTSIQKSTVCIANRVEPVSCQITNSTSNMVAIGVKQTTEASVVKGVSNIKYNFKFADGSFSTVSSNITAPGSGASASQENVDLAKNPSEVYVSSDFSLVAGSSTTCSSTPMPCA